MIDTGIVDRLDPRLSLTRVERDSLIRQPDWLVALLEENDACERLLATVSADLTERVARIAWGWP